MRNGGQVFGRTTNAKRRNDVDHQPPDLDQFIIELDDPDPLVRQEAAIGLWGPLPN